MSQENDEQKVNEKKEMGAKIIANIVSILLVGLTVWILNLTEVTVEFGPIQIIAAIIIFIILEAIFERGCDLLFKGKKYENLQKQPQKD